MPPRNEKVSHCHHDKRPPFATTTKGLPFVTSLCHQNEKVPLSSRRTATERSEEAVLRDLHFLAETRITRKSPSLHPNKSGDPQAAAHPATL
jgi:hypothetical protein